MHYCVTTAPDRPAFAPFESVPVAFRNYSVSTDGGGTWKYVAVGVPRQGQLIRREAPKAGAKASPQVTASAQVLNHGALQGKISAAGGKAAAGGKLQLTLLSSWGEPLQTQAIAVTAQNASGPWTYKLTQVPDYPGSKLSVSYTGAWSPHADLIGGESTSFNVAIDANTTANVTIKGSTKPQIK